MALASVQENKDQRHILRRLRGFASAEQLRQANGGTEQGCSTDAKCIPPCQAIAESGHLKNLNG
jgi:hypothetical protein